MDTWMTTSEAAKRVGYRVAYIRLLCRLGRVQAQKWGRAWMVNRESILSYKRQMDALGTSKHNPRRGNPLSESNADATGEDTKADR
jgi:excisionase family DNA binding protein